MPAIDPDHHARIEAAITRAASVVERNRQARHWARIRRRHDEWRWEIQQGDAERRKLLEDAQRSFAWVVYASVIALTLTGLIRGGRLRRFIPQPRNLPSRGLLSPTPGSRSSADRAAQTTPALSAPFC